MLDEQTRGFSKSKQGNVISHFYESGFGINFFFRIMTIAQNIIENS